MPIFQLEGLATFIPAKETNNIPAATRIYKQGLAAGFRRIIYS